MSQNLFCFTLYRQTTSNLKILKPHFNICVTIIILKIKFSQTYTQITLLRIT